MPGSPTAASTQRLVHTYCRNRVMNAPGSELRILVSGFLTLSEEFLNSSSGRTTRTMRDMPSSSGDHRPRDECGAHGRSPGLRVCAGSLAFPVGTSHQWRSCANGSPLTVAESAPELPPEGDAPDSLLRPATWPATVNGDYLTSTSSAYFFGGTV